MAVATTMVTFWWTFGAEQPEDDKYDNDDRNKCIHAFSSWPVDLPKGCSAAKRRSSRKT
jgi:hypothetical protein